MIYNFLVIFILSQVASFCESDANVGASNHSVMDSEFSSSRAYSVIESNGQLVLVGNDIGQAIIEKLGVDPVKMIATGQAGMKAIALGTGFLTVGQWDSNIIRWDGSSKKAVYTLKLFDGLSAALASHGDEVAVAGANVDKNAAVSEYDDYVPLLPGQLFSISPNGEYQQLFSLPKGQIDKMAMGKGWLVFQNSEKPGKLFLLKDKKPEEIALGGDEPTLSMIEDQNKAVLMNSKEILEFDPGTGDLKVIFSFPEDLDFFLLEIAVVQKELFVMSSKGVISLPSMNNITNAEEQPADIAVHNNSLLILWPDGRVDQYDVHKKELKRVYDLGKKGSG